MSDHYGLKRTTPDDPFNLPGDLQTLAEGVEAELVRIDSQISAGTPGKLIKQSIGTVSSTNTTNNALVITVAAPVYAGRIYEVGAWNVGVYAGDYARARLELKYALNASVTLSSTTLSASQLEIPNPPDFVYSMDCITPYQPSTDHTLNLGLVIVPQQATTFVRTYGADDWTLSLSIYDKGPAITIGLQS